jgi:hypothetical protein
MGTDSALGWVDETPARDVRLGGLGIDATEVTDARFGHIVAAAGYLARAERTADTVYVDGRAASTPEEYARQAVAMVAYIPTKVDETEWLPLGTFTFTREDVDDSQSMMELAINKQGVVAETYFNEATGASRALNGMVDQECQRVAIGFADGKNRDIVLETGLVNLTEDEAPGLLQIRTEQSAPVLLVRLPVPEGEKQR